jgi:hypothetical protein
VHRVQDEIKQLRERLAFSEQEMMAPGVDVVISQLQDAEALNLKLQREIVAAQKGQKGMDNSTHALKAELMSVKSKLGEVERQNGKLKSDLKVWPLVGGMSNISHLLGLFSRRGTQQSETLVEILVDLAPSTG